MNMHLLAVGAKLVGSGWLLSVTFVTAGFAVIAVHGAYMYVALFLALTLLCLAGVVMMWCNKSLHWLTAVAFAVSLALAVYGQISQ